MSSTRRILLVNSLTDGVGPMEPVALTQLAAILLQNHIEVQIHSCMPIQENYSGICKEIERRGSTFVGFSMWSHNAEFVLFVCRKLKSLFPNITTIVGGYAAPEASKFPDPAVNFYVIGEGETPLLEIVKGAHPRKKQATVLGPIEYNVEDLPFPARELVDYEKIPFLGELNHPNLMKKSYTYIFTYRGCPFSCSFCAVHEVYGRRIRKKSIRSVMKELNHLYEVNGMNAFINEEDVLFTDKARVLALCDAIVASPYKFVWTCSGTIRCMDTEILSALKAAGCKYVFIGSISGNDDILREAGVGFNTGHLTRALEAAGEATMPISSSFLVGFPNETHDTLADTARFIESNRELYWDVGVGIVRPFDGTPIAHRRRQSFGTPTAAEIACVSLTESDLQAFVASQSNIVDFTF